MYKQAKLPEFRLLQSPFFNNLVPMLWMSLKISAKTPLFSYLYLWTISPQFSKLKSTILSAIRQT